MRGGGSSSSSSLGIRHTQNAREDRNRQCSSVVVMGAASIRLLPHSSFQPIYKMKSKQIFCLKADVLVHR